MGNVRAFLMQEGLIGPADLPTGSGEFRIVCPSCSHPSAKCYVNGAGNGVLCFHCKFRCTWRGFMRRYEPPTPQEQAMSDYVAAAHAFLLADTRLMTWFEERGMDADVVKAQKFGWHNASLMPAATDVDQEIGLTWHSTSLDWMLENRIIIPYIRDGVVESVRGREHPDLPQTQKYMSLRGDTARPYYPSQIDPEQPVVITEGEFDAVVVRVNGIQAIGVPGANAAKTDWFRGYHNLYVAFDGDDAGREGTKKLLQGIEEIRRIELPEGFDSSEFIASFGLPSYQKLIENATYFLHGKPQQDDRFSKIVDDYVNWAWTNGELLGPAIPWAPRFEAMMSGWAPGLILMGAEAHHGKSSFMVKSLYELCVDNPDDSIGVYLSLDDTMQEAMTRMTSLHSGIDFNLIVKPRYSFANDQNQLDHYNKSMEELKSIGNLIIRDATYGRSLGYLRSFFSSLRRKHPEKRIVVFIDSLAKITSGGDKDDAEGATKNNWKAYLASELKYLTTKHKICVVTPTDLRKLNGARRPTRDDLKDAAELAYEANVILLAYSDLKRMRDKAVLTWQNPTTGKIDSVFEMINDKNKVTGRLGTIRFRMDGSTCNFWEVTQSEDDQYTIIANAQVAQTP